MGHSIDLCYTDTSNRRGETALRIDATTLRIRPRRFASMFNEFEVSLSETTVAFRLRGIWPVAEASTGETCPSVVRSSRMPTRSPRNVSWTQVDDFDRWGRSWTSAGRSRPPCARDS